MAKKTITGVVTSAKADKTIVITSQTRKAHRLYRKQYTVSTKFMAHDEKNEAQLGDTVLITECRPISARKHFILTQVISHPKLAEESLTAAKSEDSGKTRSAAEAAEPATEEKA